MVLRSTNSTPTVSTTPMIRQIQGFCTKLADAAGEKMKAKYGFGEIKILLKDVGFSIVEYIDDDEMTHAFFEAYNLANEYHAMAAPKGVSYCLAEKRGISL